MALYEKGNVRIHYQEAGSGFPLFVIPGGGQNSTIGFMSDRAPFNATDEFKDEYRCITADLRNHAELLGFDDSDWAVIPPADLGVRRGGGLVSFIWFRATLTIPANAAGFDTAGAKAVFRVNVDDYAEVWINGAMPRTPGRPSPGAIQGFNMPNRVVLVDSVVSPGDRFEIAVFAINGPISAAPGNFLFFREAKVEFFR
jgi:hypothetical protein